jgi:2-polyprenyl-3-methyl-5-hydroxy-6-metoxy-1,4-benzoquinol methylase
MKCRHCEAPLSLPLVDLGSSPPSNAYLDEAALRAPEKWFPLRVLVCEQCWLAQTEDCAQAHELFDPNYAYFSAFSTSWLQHCERYVGMVADRFALGPASHVVEVAANDGYLLQYVKARGITCTGIEPTASTAAAARGRGIDIVEEFFGVHLAQRLAAQGKQADLMAANNVLAHVPDINDFVAGFATLLKPQGVATFEFPQLLQLLAENQFDTIYHEHFSYLSLIAVQRIFAANGLSVFYVDTLPTHGGSLRVYAQRSDTGRHSRSPRVDQQLAREQAARLLQREGYAGFQQRAEKVKDDLHTFLIQARKEGKRVVAYGAAAKGNTLLNFAGVRPDLLPFVLDRNPAKQGHYMPGSRIPILAPEGVLERERPDYVLVLPWNLVDEVKTQLAGISQWGGRFVTAVPQLIIH